MSSLTSKKHLAEYDIQPYGPPCGITISVKIWFAPQSSSMTSAVQTNGSMEEWSRTTVGVRQGCLLSPTLFNIFLTRVMPVALEEHDRKVSIGGKKLPICGFATTGAPAEEE